MTDPAQPRLADVVAQLVLLLLAAMWSAGLTLVVLSTPFGYQLVALALSLSIAMSVTVLLLIATVAPHDAAVRLLGRLRDNLAPMPIIVRRMTITMTSLVIAPGIWMAIDYHHYVGQRVTGLTILELKRGALLVTSAGSTIGVAVGVISMISWLIDRSRR